MKIVRCDNNKHFYDADTYDACPHCRKQDSAASRPAQAGSPKDKKSANAPAQPRPRRTGGRPVSQARTAPDNPSDAERCDNCGAALYPPNRSCAKCGWSRSKDGGDRRTSSLMDQPLTASIFDGLSRARVSAEYTERSPKKPSGAPETPDASLAVPPSFSRVTEPLSQDGQFPASPAAFPLGDPDRRLMSSKATSSHLLDQARKDEELIREVNAAASYSAEDDAKTLSYYDLATTEESPVVGWLVCVSGVYQGQSFRLKSGQNNVGRQQSMDVALARENSISRRRHALIIYDPASSDFYVQHGEGSGLTYLNGELVMTPKRLSSYDKLRLGAVEFVFMAFCGEKFTWDGDVKEDGLPSTTSNDDKSGGGGRS